MELVYKLVNFTFDVFNVTTQSNNFYESFIDSCLKFFYAVDWKNEIWLQGLFAFYIGLLIFVLLTRKQLFLQSIVFIGLCACVFFAESLNRILGKYWDKFSTQNYFDKYGIFVSIVWSTPLLIIVLIILVINIFLNLTLLR